MVPPASPSERAAERQLAAYNALDTEAFAACYTEDVEAFDLAKGERLFQGRPALKERYGRLFAANPRQHCRLLARLVQGRFVVDHEEITGREGAERLFAIAIYEVEGDLIRRVWFLVEPPASSGGGTAARA